MLLETLKTLSEIRARYISLPLIVHSVTGVHWCSTPLEPETRARKQQCDELERPALYESADPDALAALGESNTIRM